MILRLINNIKSIFPLNKCDTYTRNFNHLNIDEKHKILDIGADTSLVLKSIFHLPEYVAVEPKKSDSHHKLGKFDKLFHDKWPPKNFSYSTFDFIFLLTVLDEIEDKEAFLSTIKPHMNSKTKLLIAVRNNDFPFRVSKSVPTIEGNQIPDLGLQNYKNLLSKHFKIGDIKHFRRPISFINNTMMLKTILLRAFTLILPKKYTYMLLIELTVK